jgi:hypothetical protein
VPLAVWRERREPGGGTRGRDSMPHSLHCVAGILSSSGSSRDLRHHSTSFTTQRDIDRFRLPANDSFALTGYLRFRWRSAMKIGLAIHVAVEKTA